MLESFINLHCYPYKEKIHHSLFEKKDPKDYMFFLDNIKEKFSLSLSLSLSPPLSRSVDKNIIRNAADFKFCTHFSNVMYELRNISCTMSVIRDRDISNRVKLPIYIQ